MGTPSRDQRQPREFCRASPPGHAQGRTLLVAEPAALVG